MTVAKAMLDQMTEKEKDEPALRCTSPVLGA